MANRFRFREASGFRKWINPLLKRNGAQETSCTCPGCRTYMDGHAEACAYGSLQCGDYEPMKRLAKAGKISCAEHMDELRQAVRRENEEQQCSGRKTRKRKSGLFSSGMTFAPREPDNVISSFVLFLEVIVAKSKAEMTTIEAIKEIACIHGIAVHAVRDAFERHIIRKSNDL